MFWRPDTTYYEHLIHLRSNIIIMHYYVIIIIMSVVVFCGVVAHVPLMCSLPHVHHVVIAMSMLLLWIVMKMRPNTTFGSRCFDL